ncbi:hypothetical protein H2198_010252 [Neophaeococcomyces mojaviensis]|uniref:Uncharacterized protein n=1 Tax=Neophaeococcomyces mojaviensis TaxID=3383035 RepID=A0ACC2ZSH8_9EURO|nr:hypothetical protein H2198_010252 [Knufia sp. JES_112]
MFLTILATAIAIISAYAIMNLLTSKNQFDVSGRTVIITGGSQGLGLAIAQQLAGKGANVVIVAQTESKLEKALEHVRSSAVKPSQRFQWLSYDLRKASSAPAIIEEVTRWNNGEAPDVVFNCAGHCIPGFLASSSVDTLRDQMDTLYWSCTYMAHATLQSWIQPVRKDKQSVYNTKPRHLVFTSSVVAFLPLAGYAPYSPAKAAMRALADTLNQEVQVYNGARSHATEPGPAAEIKVHAVYPLGIQSPGFENEQKLKPALTQKLEEDDKPQDPDELAKLVIQELEAGKYSVTVSLVGHLMQGWAMGGSQRVGVMDYLYGWLGSLVVLFIVPDFMSKCYQWGKKHGLSGSM